MATQSPEEIPTAVEAALNGRDVDALIELYEPGAVLVVPPGGERVSGFDAIRTAIEPMFARAAGATIDLVGKLENGDLAMTHSDWTVISVDDEGQTEQMTGRGTVVSRRQPDGSWRIVFDNPLSR